MVPKIYFDSCGDINLTIWAYLFSKKIILGILTFMIKLPQTELIIDCWHPYGTLSADINKQVWSDKDSPSSPPRGFVNNISTTYCRASYQESFCPKVFHHADMTEQISKMVVTGGVKR